MIAVAQARPSERARFIRRTYGHLAGAVAAFIILEYSLFAARIAQSFAEFIFSFSYAWLAVLGGFGLLGWMARNLAANQVSIELQYAGLGIYVLVEAIIFAPLIYIAAYLAGPEVLPTAAVLTGLLFAGLTAIAFTTKKDFSFLQGILTVASFIALGLIVCSILFGFSLGLVFSVVMVAFAGAAILYDTSNVIHHYATNQYVAASLELFASVALLFWYVLRIVIALSSRN